jgi:hypothetical protein
VSNARAAELERTTAQARTAAMANGVGVKSRLQAVQIALVLTFSRAVAGTNTVLPKIPGTDGKDPTITG